MAKAVKDIDERKSRAAWDAWRIEHMTSLPSQNRKREKPKPPEKITKKPSREA